MALTDPPQAEAPAPATFGGESLNDSQSSFWCSLPVVAPQDHTTLASDAVEDSVTASAEELPVRDGSNVEVAEQVMDNHQTVLRRTKRTTAGKHSNPHHLPYTFGSTTLQVVAQNVH